MGTSGAVQAIYYGSAYGCCMEVTSPSKAPYTYMVESFFDGCGCIIAPSITGKPCKVNVSIEHAFPTRNK